MSSEPAGGKTGREQQRLAYAIGAFLLLALALFDYSALPIGALLGGAIAALMPPHEAREGGSKRWRRTGEWQIGFGLAMLGAYALLRGPLGLGTQSSRFLASWHQGVAIDPRALVEHPWGWAPIALALGALAAGLLTRWRAR